jgi:hypothetical protein
MEQATISPAMTFRRHRIARRAEQSLRQVPMNGVRKKTMAQIRSKKVS